MNPTTMSWVLSPTRTLEDCTGPQGSPVPSSTLVPRPSSDSLRGVPLSDGHTHVSSTVRPETTFLPPVPVGVSRGIGFNRPEFN